MECESPSKPRFRGWIHVWACAISAVAGIVLVAVAAGVSLSATVATAVYSVSVTGLFGTSAVYHRVYWTDPRHRMWMKRADHSMIFVLIAGTYTPIVVLGGLPGASRSALLDVVWFGGLAGVLLKLLWPTAPRWVGVLLYLLLGWAIVPFVPAVLHTIGAAPLVLLAVGGVLYSAGAILYATKWPNPWPRSFGHHEFFHAATVAAAASHCIAVWVVVLRT
ncbi:PAQR family membrane homeostasis protein TrhA [Nocardia stercoris]|uniref:Hemolysin III family protein n=1 Tax=Nocardia stercoris TaxID=2483361 RepID=A0A3M2LIM0_9NOCA|nr:hemolysin III family protein [Nocardia stercoris]RMI35865.1 hemolysin III family protein [Nocardia stercoris]